MTKSYLTDPAFMDIASLLAAFDPPKSDLSDISAIASALALPPPPRNALADALKAFELSDVGRAMPPPNGLFGLAQALKPPELADILRTPWDVPAPPVPSSLSVRWAKPASGWWTLNNAAQIAPDQGCVYVIWRDGDGWCVKVGQGNGADRLSAHCCDRTILASANGNTLRATWTPVLAHLRNGVERFLGDHYQPMIAQRFPDARPISVNLPS